MKNENSNNKNNENIHTLLRTNLPPKKEPLVCGSYSLGSSAGFVYHEVKQGDIFRLSDNSKNWLFFFLEGDAKLHYNDDRPFFCKGGEFTLLPKTITQYSCMAISDIRFIAHVFDAHLGLCDKTALQTLASFCTDKSTIALKKLDIRKPLDDFLTLLAFYLKYGVLCKHMHEVKQRELFLIMRAFYSIAENAGIFVSLISKNLDFKDIVLTNYLNSRSINELARLCHCSQASFNRNFKENFHESPRQWIQKQKAKQIVIKLSDESIPLNDIADQFGFSSAAHFTTFCKKTLRMTPSQFRKQSVKERITQVNDLYKKNA